MGGKFDNGINLFDLIWDTEFFGVTCAKAVLNTPLTLSDWEELKKKFKDYQFISIVNKNSEPVNAQLISKDTSAFLADVNIQFTKQIETHLDVPKNITIYKSLKKDNQIIEMADFQFSKFTEDPELAKRGGDKLYRQWLLNSFYDDSKYFAISNDENGDINGFLLHSYSDNNCLIELIAVSKTSANNGLGTVLFRAVENEAKLHGMNEIKVGTQVRNMNAINFYHKVGCKQIGCHQVYHLWNL